MDKTRKNLAKWIIGIAAACIVLFLALQNLDVLARAVGWAAGLVFPLLLGVAVAVILNVPMSFFERYIFAKTEHSFLQSLRRPLSFILALVMILGIIAGVVWLVIPELVDAITVAVEGAIELVDHISKMDRAKIAELPFGGMLLNADWDKLVDSMRDWVKNQSGVIVGTAVDTLGSLFGWIADLFIALIFAIYILFSKSTLKRQAARLTRAWLPERFSGWTIHAAKLASANLRAFISGKTLDAAIMAALCMVGMLALQIPYVPMVGALVGVTALIPVVGGFIGAGVGAFVILTTDPIKALIFLIFIIVLQQLEGNLIYPKIVGDRLKLPGIWVL
ncbi:MAG: AI-2E family transporter, partial [Clostridia bacterium]|nr:AI-2E family transporter [Clostridia bacterium]